MSSDTNVLALTDDETETLKEITKLSRKVKKLVIDAEEWNNKEAYAPTLLEIRNSQDHLMRFFAFKFGLKTDVPASYPRDNLLKVKAHLFRAGYDSLDYLSVRITKNILKRLEPFSNDAIATIIPDFYPKILPDLDNISKTVADIRAFKDMDTKSSDFDRHIEAIEKLRSHNIDVLGKMNSLTEFEARRKHQQEEEMKEESRRDIKNMIIGGIIVGVIILIIQVVFHLY